MSSFELFEQRDYERNCSKRISPRRARNNKLLPPECHQTILSSCNERVSPRRQRGIDCLDFLGPQQPTPSQIQRQSSSSETRRGNIVINSNRSTNGSSNRSNNGSSVRNGSNGRSTTPQNTPIETVTVVETSSVSPNNQVIEKYEQEINKLQQENNKLQRRLSDCERLQLQQEPRLLGSSLRISSLFDTEKNKVGAVDDTEESKTDGNDVQNDGNGAQNGGNGVTVDGNEGRGFFGNVAQGVRGFVNYVRGR